MSGLYEQIEWLRKSFSIEAKKCRSKAINKIDFTFYEKVIENTKRRYINDPLYDELDNLIVEFSIGCEDYQYC